MPTQKLSTYITAWMVAGIFANLTISIFEYAPMDTVALERAIQALFFMPAFLTDKTYLPPEIVIEQGRVRQANAAILLRYESVETSYRANRLLVSIFFRLTLGFGIKPGWGTPSPFFPSSSFSSHLCVPFGNGI